MSAAACMMPPRAAHYSPDRYDKPNGVGGRGLPSSSGESTLVLRSSKSGDTKKKRQPDSATTAALNRTPVEVLVQVFRNLDMETALSLAATTRRFANIYRANRASIVLAIAAKEFSPLNGLLQVVKASPADVATPWGTWLDKCIRRKNVVLCPGGTLPSHCPGSTQAMKISCAEVRLDDDRDIDRLIAVCRTVRGWESIFPRHRFNASPHLTRSLLPEESFRLRRALYNWMRYAYYFHGELRRPNVFVPAGRDPRINQLRVLPNSQLGELRDLWNTVEDIVTLTLCPSIENVRISADFTLSEVDAARIGWGEQRDNGVVVATVSKLPPDELLHYLDNSHKYTKARLVQDIRQRHAQFEADTESLTSALSCVSLERWLRLQAEQPALVQEAASCMCMPGYSWECVACRGGILDCDEAEEEEEEDDEEDAEETFTEEGGEKKKKSTGQLSEMTGHGLDWRSEHSFFGFRPEIRPGMLNPRV